MVEAQNLDSKYSKKSNLLVEEPCVNGLIPRSHPRKDPIGCYALKENANDTLNGLNGLSFSDPYRDDDKTLMDPGLCINHCGNYLFKYAALANGTDCRCGKDEALENYSKVDALNCNLPCVGNSTYKCGGNSTYTIYDTSELPDDKKPKITIEEKLAIIRNFTSNTSNSFYRGCIKDNPECNNRVLNGNSEKLPGMTVDYCINFCHGYKYAGLETGNECFCGNSYKYSFLKTEECGTSCVGNSYQVCGGPLALSIYEVNQTSSSPTTVTSVVNHNNPALTIGLSTGLGATSLLAIGSFVLVCKLKGWLCF